MLSNLRYLIRSMIKSSDDYDEKYIKIKFDLDDDLPLNETLEIQNVTMIVRAVFYKNSKYYRQVFLDERLYKLWIIWKCYILIELTFFKELMLIKKTASKECHYQIFLNKGFKFQPNDCNRCHDLLIVSMNLSDIAISNINGSNCCFIIWKLVKVRPYKLNARYWFDQKKVEHYKTICYHI